MKFKIAILSIVATTFGLIGLMYGLINQDEIIAKNKNKAASIAPQNDTKLAKAQHFASVGSLSAKEDSANEIDENEEIDDGEDDEDFEEDNEIELVEGDDAEKKNSLDELDKKTIKQLTSLSDIELAEEFNALKKELEANDLIEQLESGKLDEKSAKEAKKTLERFSLLGLENTRRKFADIEPELADKENSHQETLKEVREMLDNY